MEIQLYEVKVVTEIDYETPLYSRIIFDVKDIGEAVGVASRRCMNNISDEYLIVCGDHEDALSERGLSDREREMCEARTYKMNKEEL